MTVWNIFRILVKYYSNIYMLFRMNRYLIARVDLSWTIFLIMLGPNLWENALIPVKSCMRREAVFHSTNYDFRFVRHNTKIQSSHTAYRSNNSLCWRSKSYAYQYCRGRIGTANNRAGAKPRHQQKLANLCGEQLCITRKTQFYPSSRSSSLIS